MRVLILTGQFGMGHLCASYAVKQEIKDSYPDAIIDIVDFLEFALPNIHNVIYSAFNFIVSKMPKLFNLFFRLSDNNSNNIYPFRKFAINKIDILIKRFSPNLIISVTPVTSKYVSIYKESKKLKNDIPLFTIITDISYHSQWISTSSDAYFVPCEELKSCLIKKGVKSERVYITGIPVREEFRVQNYTPVKKSYKNILIMGGGIGLIPKCDNILYQLNQISNLSVTVITGKNEKLYKKLKNKYSNIEILGYTDNISQLMRTADILISKPGCITLFEAIHSSLPIFIIKPVLAHEVFNADYVEEAGIGKVIWHRNSRTYRELTDLLYNDYELNIIKNRMRNIKNQTQKNKLCNILKDLRIQ